MSQSVYLAKFVAEEELDEAVNQLQFANMGARDKDKFNIRPTDDAFQNPLNA